MLTPSITSASPWLFFKVWVAEHLEKFSSLFNIKSTYFSDNLIEMNELLIRGLNKKREDANHLTPSIAKEKLKKFKDELRTYERVGQYVSGSSNIPLKNSFRLLVKTAYKYEARLHKIAHSDKPVIKTPEHIKEAFSEMGKESVKSYFESHNAF